MRNYVFLELFLADGKTSAVYVETHGDFVCRIYGDNIQDAARKIILTFPKETIMFVDTSFLGTCLTEKISRHFTVYGVHPKRIEVVE